MIRKYVSFIKPYKVAAILTPILVLVEVIADVLMPFLMSSIVDVGIKNANRTYIYRTGGIMVLLALTALTCGALSAKLGAIAAQGFGFEVRQKMFQKIQEFSFANLDKFNIPSLITRLTNDINNLQQSLMMGLRMLVRAPFMIILALIMVLSINKQLATIFLVAIPLLSILLYIIMTCAYPRFRLLQKKLDQFNTTIQESLINIRVIKSFVRTDYEKVRFQEVNNSLMKSAIHAVSLVILNGPLMQLIMYGCIISILWFGGKLVIGGTLLTGQLISFITYVNQILVSLMMISMLFLMFTRAKASAERVLEVLECEIDITSKENEWKDIKSGKENPLKELKGGSVEFRNVSFRYPNSVGNDTLNNINLKFSSGETIGILGATGSGKSSLVQLISRLYDVTEGGVFVDEKDVRDWDLKVLRSSVGMVLQKNTLFTGTIRENLLWGNENATEEEIVEACKASQAWGFIEQQLMGLDTMLGQGGVNLSGGQKQRLCIARALLKKPKILILDDSTSAVDMATDAEIRKAFQTKLTGITTIIIAQRISSVEHADRIIVMEEGRINGIGTSSELLNTNRIYQEIHSIQMEGRLAG